MTAAVAHAAAEEEGLALRADNSTGFKNVFRHNKSATKPFQAQLTRGGRKSASGAISTWGTSRRRRRRRWPSHASSGRRASQPRSRRPHRSPR